MEKLLDLLSDDTASDGIAYQKLRESLVRYFEFKSDREPGEAADVTLDRAAAKIEKGENIKNITSYCFGIARLVLLERVRSAQKNREAAENFYQINGSRENEADDFAPQSECFDALPEDDRRILRIYFSDLPHARLVERRLKLVKNEKKTINQLRMRIFHLKTRLNKCADGKAGK